MAKREKKPHTQKHCDYALLYQKLYIQGEPGGKRGLCPKPRMSY